MSENETAGEMAEAKRGPGRPPKTDTKPTTGVTTQEKSASRLTPDNKMVYTESVDALGDYVNQNMTEWCGPRRQDEDQDHYLKRCFGEILTPYEVYALAGGHFVSRNCRLNILIHSDLPIGDGNKRCETFSVKFRDYTARVSSTGTDVFYGSASIEPMEGQEFNPIIENFVKSAPDLVPVDQYISVYGASAGEELKPFKGKSCAVAWRMATVQQRNKMLRMGYWMLRDKLLHHDSFKKVQHNRPGAFWLEENGARLRSQIKSRYEAAQHEYQRVFGK